MRERLLHVDDVGLDGGDGDDIADALRLGQRETKMSPAGLGQTDELVEHAHTSTTIS